MEYGINDKFLTAYFLYIYLIAMSKLYLNKVIYKSYYLNPLNNWMIYCRLLLNNNQNVSLFTSTTTQNTCNNKNEIKNDEELKGNIQNLLIIINQTRF